MSPNRCKNCEHWRGNHGETPLTNGWGRCTYAEHVHSLMRPTIHMPNFQETLPAEAGILLTQAWFGCVHFSTGQP